MSEDVRSITDHQCPGCDNIVIEALDGPGAGGASHEYAIALKGGESDFRRGCVLSFQCGGVAENGVNGITNEALLAIVIDRLRGFQNGPFRCRENAIAMTSIETALLWLKQRTAARVQRGVEGRELP